MQNITFTAFFDDIKTVDFRPDLELVAVLNEQKIPGEQITWTVQGTDSNKNLLTNNRVIWHENIKSFKVVEKLLENNKVTYRYIDDEKVQLSIEIDFLDDIDTINIYLYREKKASNTLISSKSCEGSVYFSFQRFGCSRKIKYSLEIVPKEPHRKKEFESLFLRFVKYQNEVYGCFHHEKIKTTRHIDELIEIFINNPKTVIKGGTELKTITYIPICGISSDIECLQNFVNVSKQCQNRLSWEDDRKHIFFAHYSFPFSFCREDDLDKTLRNLYVKKIDRMYYNIFTGETIRGDNIYYLWDV